MQIRCIVDTSLINLQTKLVFNIEIIKYNDLIFKFFL